MMTVFLVQFRALHEECHNTTKLEKTVNTCHYKDSLPSYAIAISGVNNKSNRLISVLFDSVKFPMHIMKGRPETNTYC
jgi:hypothetical protein